MQNRIDRLEGLVLSLMTNGNQAAGPAAAMAALSGESSAGSTGLSNEIDVDDMENSNEGNPEESDTEQVTKSFGVMKMDSGKSYYLSEAHWASILHDVSGTSNQEADRATWFADLTHNSIDRRSEELLRHA